MIYVTWWSKYFWVAWGNRRQQKMMKKKMMKIPEVLPTIRQKALSPIYKYHNHKKYAWDKPPRLEYIHHSTSIPCLLNQFFFFSWKWETTSINTKNGKTCLMFFSSSSSRKEERSNRSPRKELITNKNRIGFQFCCLFFFNNLSCHIYIYIFKKKTIRNMVARVVNDKKKKKCGKPYIYFPCLFNYGHVYIMQTWKLIS